MQSSKKGGDSIMETRISGMEKKIQTVQGIKTRS